MNTESFWNSKRVLVTGAGGFLGSRLIAMLLEAGATPVGFDLRPGSPSLKVAGLTNRFEVVTGSVTDLEAVKRALRDHSIQVVVHLAGQSKIEDSAASPVAAFEVNIRGTWTVLEACRQAGSLLGVACASSNHTYGPQRSAPFPENAPFNQLDVYGASKACADLLIRTYARQFGIPAVAVRNTNTFGPADPHTSHIITGSILRLLRDQPPLINSDGSPVKAYLYVDDTVGGYMALAAKAQDPSVRGEAYNVTAAEPVSVRDLVEMIVKVSGKTHLKPEIRATDLSQKGTYEHLSSEKIRRLGWRPRFSLEEGLQRTYDWYRQHGIGWLSDDIGQ